MPGIDDIVNDTVRLMPTPSPVSDEVIAEVQEATNNQPSSEQNGSLGKIGFPPSEPQPETTSYLRDEKGNLFDESIHSVGEDGNPVKNKDGTFRKKRGRKAGSSSSGTTDANITSRQNAMQAGKATAEAIFAVGRTIGGEEWAPIVNRDMGVDEPSQMTDAWARYYQETGKTDVPAWAGVAIAMGSYALPRMTMPATQTRLQRFTQWAKAKIFDMKTKAKKRKETK